MLDGILGNGVCKTRPTRSRFKFNCIIEQRGFVNSTNEFSHVMASVDGASIWGFGTFFAVLGDEKHKITVLINFKCKQAK